MADFDRIDREDDGLDVCCYCISFELKFLVLPWEWSISNKKQLFYHNYSSVCERDSQTSAKLTGFENKAL